MLLFELFPDDADSDPQAGPMMQQLRQAALDMITPLLGQSVPFVTMHQVIAGLNDGRFGIVITPRLIMDILNPDEVKAVDKIEGDRIYLQKPGLDSSQREVDDKQKEQDQQHVADMATDQINQELKKK
jgi:hypothetical protein